MKHHHFFLSMKAYFAIGGIAVIIGMGFYVLNKPVKLQKNEEVTNTLMMKKSEGAVMEKQDEKMMRKHGRYEAYTGSLAPTGRQVLFFHAAWCPTCRSADANITSKLSDIPTDVTIHKVDYDDSSDLKKKYGVTYQHTFVQVDASGEMITKWSGGDLNTIIQKLK